MNKEIPFLASVYIQKLPKAPFLATPITHSAVIRWAKDVANMEYSLRRELEAEYPDAIEIDIVTKPLSSETIHRIRQESEELTPRL